MWALKCLTHHLSMSLKWSILIRTLYCLLLRHPLLWKLVAHEFPRRNHTSDQSYYRILLSKYLGMWSLLAASSVEPNDHPLPVIMRHCGKHFLTLCLPVSSPWSYFASIKAMSVDGMEGTWLEGKFQCMICATFIAGDKHTLLVVT